MQTAPIRQELPRPVLRSASGHEGVGSIAKCESPTFAGTCPSETPLARTYRHLDLDQRRTLFRLVEARTPVGEIARRLGRHPSTANSAGTASATATGVSAATSR